MKYTHNVLYGGKLYTAGEEVPEGSLPDETSSPSIYDVKEEPVKEEKAAPKKRATKKQ